jgi:peptidoglycan/LPS O-acetylase OafA/YrhL
METIFKVIIALFYLTLSVYMLLYAGTLVLGSEEQGICCARIWPPIDTANEFIHYNHIWLFTLLLAGSFLFPLILSIAQFRKSKVSLIIQIVNILIFCLSMACFATSEMRSHPYIEYFYHVLWFFCGLCLAYPFFYESKHSRFAKSLILYSIISVFSLCVISRAMEFYSWYIFNR